MDSMYELLNQYLELMDMASDEDIDEEVLKDTFEALEGEIEVKADNILKVIKELEAKVEKLTKEVKRLQGMKASTENGISRLKKLIENAMKVTGKTKFKTDFASYWIQKNPASVVIDEGVNVNDLPAEYLTFEAPKVNKGAIKKALDEGKEITWAHIEQTESIRFR